MGNNDNGGTNVLDPQTQVYLLKMKEEIISAVTKTVEDGNTNTKSYLKEIYDLKIDRVDEKVDRALDHCNQHYTDIKKIKEKLSMTEGIETGHDKAQKSFMDRYGAWMIGITLLLGIAGWLFNIIF